MTTILTVYDKNHEFVASTAIRFSQIDDTVLAIKDLCLKHGWTHKLTIPYTSHAFLLELNRVANDQSNYIP